MLLSTYSIRAWFRPRRRPLDSQKVDIRSDMNDRLDAPISG
jgi:hypothetical protein